MKDSIKPWITSPPTTRGTNPPVRGGPFGASAIRDFGVQLYAISRPVKPHEAIVLIAPVGVHQFI